LQWKHLTGISIYLLLLFNFSSNLPFQAKLRQILVAPCGKFIKQHCLGLLEMSSVSRTGNRTSAVAGAIRSLQSGNTEVQEQLKSFLLDNGNQQKALLKRLEELESSNKTLVNDVQSLRVELQAVRSSASASASASATKS
jgi:hypothetical protein